MGGGRGGGGEGMETETETEARLSTGALEAMWREDGLRPVLQLADEPRMGAEAGRYRVALSDGGARLQPGMLAASLNHLVARGALRRGTVIRVLEYFAGFIRTQQQRVIIVIQLEILHAECTLIRSPTIFEANATQHIGVSCSGGLSIHESCFMPATHQDISNSSCSPEKRVLDSSVTPRAEPTVINLPFSECFCSMPAQSTVDAKMQQLSLNDHQNQRFTVTATGLSCAREAQLTPGAVAALSEHADGNGTLQPVLQVVDVRMVNNVENPNAERFRLVLSDGVYTTQSMLTTAENTRVLDGSIQKGSVIRLQEFTCSTVQNRRFIVVSKLYVLQSECNIMGNPEPYETRNQPNEQVTNLPANDGQANTGTYSSGPGMLGSSSAPRPAQAANTGTYSSDPGMLGSSAAPRPAQAANTGTYSSGPDMLGSSAALRPAQVANNVPYSGSYGGYQGTVGPPIVHAVESVPNVVSGISYGTPSAQNSTMPSLISHQNQRFPVPSMAGGSGAPGNTYGQPAQSFHQQPPAGHMNRPPVSKNDAVRLVPVAQLNPYQNSWTVKARVTAKTDIRHYNNNKGAGKVFSFDLVDGQGGEIRATCFNAQVDQFFDLIEVDKVYLISKGSLKPAQKKFNSLNHEYEITLDFKTSIEVCVDDDSNIPRQQYNFRQISEIENIEAGAIVDLIGIVTSVGPSATFIRKDGSEAQKRTLQLKDMSGRSIEITLWGKFCDAEGQQLQLQCDSGLNPVLALKGAKVSEFNGRSVSSIGSTQLKIDPDFPDAESLRRWYATEGKTAACVSLSVLSMGKTDVRKAVAQIKDENLGRSDKPDWITVKGAISHVNTDSFCYTACMVEVNGRQCSKKVVNNGDGTWHCDKCDKSFPKCEYRYLLVCQIQDHTGVTYATAFQEAGMEIMGHSALELYNMREEKPERFAEIFQGVLWQQFVFKLKVKEETYNDEPKIKCSITKAERLDPARESYYLLGVINGLLQDDTGSPSEAQGPMAGLSNTGAGLSVPTSNSAYTTNFSGARYGESANQFTNTCMGASTPVAVTGNVQACMSCGSNGHNAQNCPAGMYRQQPAASTANSYGSWQPRGPCFKCNKPGHYASSCPLQQPYRSDGGPSSGGYGRQQPYLGATNY